MYIGSVENSRGIGKREGFFWKKNGKSGNTEKRNRTKLKTGGRWDGPPVFGSSERWGRD
jgi:hypothetical protein